MILSFFRKPNRSTHVEAIYNAIVAQSRHQRFYADWGVPDTVTGRFDMISLHLGLMLRRLRHPGAGAEAFAQELFDLFFLDMDQSLREMGVGDTSVAKRIEKMGSLFYGMLGKLSEALDEGDAHALRGVIARNIFEGEDGPNAIRLADYAAAKAEEWAALDTLVILDGRLIAGTR
jgi:cytochrome b pre-mRNA-processing protein 3